MKLDAGNKRLLSLVRRGKQSDGWTPVSKMVFPLVDALPKQLVETKQTEFGPFAKLTQDGEAVVDFL